MYCLRYDDTRGMTTFAVATESLDSLYLSKSNTGIFRAWATGNNGERNETMESFTLPARNEMWFGASSLSKIKTALDGKGFSIIVVSFNLTKSGGGSMDSNRSPSRVPHWRPSNVHTRPGIVPSGCGCSTTKRMSHNTKLLRFYFL